MSKQQSRAYAAAISAEMVRAGFSTDTELTVRQLRQRLANFEHARTIPAASVEEWRAALRSAEAAHRNAVKECEYEDRVSQVTWWESEANSRRADLQIANRDLTTKPDKGIARALWRVGMWIKHLGVSAATDKELLEESLPNAQAELTRAWNELDEADVWLTPYVEEMVEAREGLQNAEQVLQGQADAVETLKEMIKKRAEIIGDLAMDFASTAVLNLVGRETKKLSGVRETKAYWRGYAELVDEVARFEIAGHSITDNGVEMGEHAGSHVPAREQREIAQLNEDLSRFFARYGASVNTAAQPAGPSFGSPA